MSPKILYSADELNFFYILWFQIETTRVGYSDVGDNDMFVTVLRWWGENHYAVDFIPYYFNMQKQLY